MVKKYKTNKIMGQNKKGNNNKSKNQNKPSKLRLIKGKDGVWRVIHEKTLYEVGVVF